MREGTNCLLLLAAVARFIVNFQVLNNKLLLTLIQFLKMPMLLILKHTFLTASMESIKVYEKLFNFDNENSELNTKYRFSIDDPLHMRRSSKFDEIQAKEREKQHRIRDYVMSSEKFSNSKSSFVSWCRLKIHKKVSLINFGCQNWKFASTNFSFIIQQVGINLK